MLQSKTKLIFFLSISVLFLFIVYFFKDKISNNLIFWIVWVLLSALISLIVQNLTGKITVKNKEVKATGGFAIFFVLISIGILSKNTEEKTFTFTIFLRNQKHESIDIKGVVRLIINDLPRDEEIDRYGSIVFKNTSNEILGKEILVELLRNEEWNFTNNSNSIKVKILSNNITLLLKNNESHCCIIGNVVDVEGKSVKGALVWTDTLSPVITNERGIFIIKLPLKRQKEENFSLTIKKGDVEEKALINKLQMATIKLKTSTKNE